jgi:hypothetical protein
LQALCADTGELAAQGWNQPPGTRWLSYFRRDDAPRLALGRVRKMYRGTDLPDLFVTLVGLGKREDFEATVPEVRAARVWRSVTPFVPPRFLKERGTNSLFGQGLRLTFDAPVVGPISLGYASHFGLGLFVPDDPEDLSAPRTRLEE